MSFDAQTVSLAGTNLIEASAGTGKTYTLAELYLRLVLEQDLNVDQILVVTYTRAATEELRDRLRQKLVDKRDQILEEPELNKKDFYKLTLAIQSFDQAAIYTIHGFCQRVLTDFTFESGLPFDVELIGDERDILQSVTDDFWRREISQADPELSAYLLARRESPETLLRSIRSLIAKPYLHYLPLPEIDINRFQETLNKQFDGVKLAWEQEQDDVITALQNKDLLNGNKYRKASVEKWLMQLMAMLELDTAPATIFENFDRFTTGKLEDALKKDQVLPVLQFWSACEQLLDANQQLQTARNIQLQNLRLSLLSYINDKVPEQKQQQQVQSYDDLLIHLDQALNADYGEKLIAQLQGQYQAALIDEFQDTDPVQYDSFSRIYAKSGLPTFYVGDPKQAIYSFRGADICTYLKAKSVTESEHTLTTNWRSHPDLVTAVNGLFMQKPQPFIYQDIPFHAVDSARDSDTVLTVEEGESSALQLNWFCQDKPLAKKEMTALAAASTADEIVRLLNLAQQGQATLKEEGGARELSGGDIAVLVRNHRQANEVQLCLQQRGINSVQQGRENVFASHEALIMEHLLLAVAEPNKDRRIATALITPLFGMKATVLNDVQQDEQAWLSHIDVFHELHQLWLQQGFMTMFRHLMMQQKVQQRLLSVSHGERQLTNLYHLAELIQDYCSRQKSAMTAVLNWLAEHRLSIDEDEAAQLRLESDEQLVKIITIHKSKGLEYPIVFCPFLWDVNLRAGKDEIIRFHNVEQDNVAQVAFVEPAITQAQEAVRVEEQAEDIRLLYVALTRAKERCVITWGAVKGVNDSALFSLLHQQSNDINAETMAVDLQQLSTESAGTISIQTLTEQNQLVLVDAQDDTPNIAARAFKGKIHKPWRIGSFSALTAGHDAELPDYDAHRDHQLQVELPKLTTQDRFGFPRGAQAGTCLHSIFELWDFKTEDKEAMQVLVARTLIQYGFDESWTDTVCQWLKEVVNTPLSASSSFCLTNLSPAQRLDEMAFYFPVVDLSVKQLKQHLLPLIADDHVLKAVINRLDFYDLNGFMKGFIDLVYEHEGRYFVVDYKSNFLGTAQQDYAASNLDEAMVSHDYPLQYLIYSLALHRYLKLRLPDYDPEQHLGGVYYLFIRGMHPEWGSAGIFADRPSAELITAFDNYLQGISDE
jgi:exodeoxyribonuclease V beta subunit